VKSSFFSALTSRALGLDRNTEHRFRSARVASTVKLPPDHHRGVTKSLAYLPITARALRRGSLEIRITSNQSFVRDNHKNNGRDREADRYSSKHREVCWGEKAEANEKDSAPKIKTIRKGTGIVATSCKDFT
jgi:hypothetical protein